MKTLQIHTSDRTSGKFPVVIAGRCKRFYDKIS